ncbi:hypothetical protein T440DRAFT_516831 [Plenodomus tracheiphilus IPT5]|uniref:Uncharacterized protein n=1 Tax=Plenodomus tracheiphilus IPT5 TaxID=1408161 RepID=A0A6A7BAP5_9PLEO|nr:hypothetical protein T440DRAFT_516831 [Plenodomus tracheiphilus IPT5]
MRASIARNPSQSLSHDPKENRSFHYFQAHTLPRWTEFFASEPWCQKVLQLSHTEPAILHGVLALSSLHERFENTASVFCDLTHDFAFVQYMSAVRRSNELLKASHNGKVDLEKVLMACIIFTCYENLAGNYASANMHIRNGLNIMAQHKDSENNKPMHDSIGHVLYRFDLQAMTFSDNSSPYKYELGNAPDCPKVPATYTSNTGARNDIVRLFRCMLWVSGVADNDPQAPAYAVWTDMYSNIMQALDQWESSFAKYLQSLTPSEQADKKLSAGNTLLKMYVLVTRIIAGTGGGMATELAWDAFVDSFGSIVDLAQTLPVLQPQIAPLTRSCSPHSPSSGPGTSAPVSGNNSPCISPGIATVTHHSDHPAVRTTPAPSDVASMAKRAPISFSPSFELSPIVPLFLTITRCRDPLIRRRALALLLTYRRREGVWDSLGAASVAAECLKREEDMRDASIGPNNWLPLSPTCMTCSDVPEWRRVKDLFIGVQMAEGNITLTYAMTNGVRWTEIRSIQETPTFIVSRNHNARSESYSVNYRC